MAITMKAITSLIKKFSGSLALITGAVSAIGFAPIGWWLAALLSISALIFLLLHSNSAKKSFKLGWLWGVGHFAITLQWIAFAFTFQDALPVWLGWGAVVGFALYLAIFPAIAAFSAQWIRTKLSLQSQSHSFALTFTIILSATWILSEWLRATLFTGFGWNPLSASMIDTILSSFLPWLGSYGVSGSVIITAGISMMMLRQLTWTQLKAKNYWGLAFFPLLMLVVYSGITGYTYNPGPAEDADITIVQPNISQADKYREGYNQINYTKLSELSAPLKDQNKARIILWPEAAIPDYLESGYPKRAYFNTMGGGAKGALLQIGALMRKDDILLTGGTRLEWEGNNLTGARNSVMALQKNTANDSAELFATYDKSHLLPMGEYVPLRAILEPIGIARFVPGDIDFWPGKGPATLTIPSHNKAFGGVKIGIQICYELVFSGRVIDRENRPDFIFSPSNDAWFGPWGPPQHEAQGRLRAIEEGIPIIRVTPTGVSSEIYSNGHIFERIEAGVAGRLNISLPQPSPPTFFAKYGNMIPISLALLILLITFISTIAINRKPR